MTPSGGSSSIFSKLLDASAVSFSAVSKMKSLCLPSYGSRLASRCTSLTWSMLICVPHPPGACRFESDDADVGVKSGRDPLALAALVAGRVV